MPVPLLLKNGRIIDPVNQIDHSGDVLIVDGHIVSPVSTAPADTQEIDVKGCWLVPGRRQQT